MPRLTINVKPSKDTTRWAKLWLWLLEPPDDSYDKGPDIASKLKQGPIQTQAEAHDGRAE